MAKMIRPALYKLPGVDCDWVWAQLKDIAQAINTTPFTVWIAYFELTKDGYMLPVSFESWGAGTIWNVNFYGKVVSGLGTGQYALGSEEAFFEVLSKGDLFVPAGWATKILKIHEAAVLHC